MKLEQNKNERRKDKNSLLIVAEVEGKTVYLKADFQKCILILRKPQGQWPFRGIISFRIE